MNDVIDSGRMSGKITFDGTDVYEPTLDVVQLRARVGMVFQKPNPFPKTIYENVAYGPRIHGIARNNAELDEIVHRSLTRAGLNKKDHERPHPPGTGLPGGPAHRRGHARSTPVTERRATSRGRGQQEV